MFKISQFRFLFVAFCFTGILILAVFLRTANNRIFYELCTYRAQLNRLKQELGARQLRLEGLINPAAVYERLDNVDSDNQES
jgi:hypothetical protein